MAMNSNLLMLLFVGTGILALAVLTVTIGPVIKRVMGQTTVKLEGQDARATIRDVQDTGVEVNERPQVKFVVWVEPSTIPAYQAELVVTASVVELANQYRVGAQIHVRYDPKDPSKLALIGPYTAPTTADSP